MDRDRLESLLRTAGVGTRRATANAVNVCCPLCPTPDSGYHCGVFLSNLRFHCWRCRSTGSLRRLLEAFGLDEIAISRALGGTLAVVDHHVSLLDRVRAALGGRVAQAAAVAPAPPVELPPSDPIDEYTLCDSPALRGFLHRRRISIKTCLRYDARWGGNVGPHAHRIILPVYGEDGRLVAWQSRDATNRARSKYLTGGRTSEALYWTDLEFRDGALSRIYVVEGVFDAWRMGVNAVGTFSHALSQTQRWLLLAEDRAEEVVFAWDGDSYSLALAAARELAPMVRAGVMRLPDGEDPDSLGRERIIGMDVRWA